MCTICSVPIGEGILLFGLYCYCSTQPFSTLFISYCQHICNFCPLYSFSITAWLSADQVVAMSTFFCCQCKAAPLGHVYSHASITRRHFKNAQSFSFLKSSSQLYCSWQYFINQTLILYLRPFFNFHSMHSGVIYPGNIFAFQLFLQERTLTCPLNFSFYSFTYVYFYQFMSLAPK